MRILVDVVVFHTDNLVVLHRYVAIDVGIGLSTVIFVSEVMLQLCVNDQCRNLNQSGIAGREKFRNFALNGVPRRPGSCTRSAGVGYGVSSPRALLVFS